MGQCMSRTQRFPLYFQIPRDLSSSVHFVSKGYSELLDIDDITVTKRRLRIVRKLLERSSATACFDSLSISFCVFDNAVVQQELAAFIQTSCPNVTCLTFAHNEMRGTATHNLDFLLVALAEKQMQEVEINDRTIYGAVGEQFLQALVLGVSMQRLRLKYMSLDMPAIRGLCSGLATMRQSTEKRTTLRELTLCDCWVDDEMLATLVETLCCCRATPLTRLDLQSNSFSPAAVPALARLLRTNSGLEKLILDRNESMFFGVDVATANDFCNALADHNTTLRYLSLTFTDLGDVMAIPLFKALETNTTLAHLDIEDSFVGVEGYRQFITSLPVMRGLREVSVGWDDLFDEFPESLQTDALRAIRRNQSIYKFNETAMYYNDNDEYRTQLAFCFARNRQMTKALKVLQTTRTVHASAAAWKVALPRMAQHASASSAVFEILRHCLPTHNLLPVTPLPKAQQVEQEEKKKKAATDIDLMEGTTTSWADDWSEQDDEFLAQVLDQEDIVANRRRAPALAIAYPVYSR